MQNTYAYKASGQQVFVEGETKDGKFLVRPIMEDDESGGEFWGEIELVAQVFTKPLKPKETEQHKKLVSELEVVRGNIAKSRAALAELEEREKSGKTIEARLNKLGDFSLLFDLMDDKEIWVLEGYNVFDYRASADERSERRAISFRRVKDKCGYWRMAVCLHQYSDLSGGTTEEAMFFRSKDEAVQAFLTKVDRDAVRVFGANPYYLDSIIKTCKHLGVSVPEKIVQLRAACIQKDIESEKRRYDANLASLNKQASELSGIEGQGLDGSAHNG